MNMEIARLANVSWLQVPDRQVAAVRAVLLSMDDWRGQPGGASVKAAQPVPVLDWPADLFQDESIDN